MMTKSEILSTTLNELIERFRHNPECFDYVGIDIEGSEFRSKLPFENIVWQTKVESGGTMIDDPTCQPKTIVITYSSLDKNMLIRIFNKTYANPNDISNQAPDAYLEYSRWFMRLGKNYKKFKLLKKLILTKYQRREATSFLSKLASIFPSILDDHILGK